MGVQRKSGKRRYDTPESKHEAVRLVTEGGLSMAQVARDLGLTDNLVSRWKKEAQENGQGAFPGQGHPQDEELFRLRREVEVLRQEREVLKKSSASSRPRPSPRAAHEQVAHERVAHEHLEAGGTTDERTSSGLMRESRLVARKPRRFVVTTDSNHAFPVALNALNRKYQVANVAGLNRVWAGDITYVPTAQGCLYVAVVLDLKSRRVIGWSMRDSLEQTLVHEALEMALGQRLPSKSGGALLFHSDRGSQYAAHDHQERLLDWSIVCSMSRKGNCWDNAVVESFFATLKKEEVHRQRYLSHEQAKDSLFFYY